jgi:hypothetical protein
MTPAAAIVGRLPRLLAALGISDDSRSGPVEVPAREHPQEAGLRHKELVFAHYLTPLSGAMRARGIHSWTVTRWS